MAKQLSELIPTVHAYLCRDSGYNPPPPQRVDSELEVMLRDFLPQIGSVRKELSRQARSASEIQKLRPKGRRRIKSSAGAARAAYLIGRRLKEGGVSPFGEVGAALLHEIGYGRIPRGTSKTDKAVNRFHNLARTGEAAIKDASTVG